MQIHFKVFDSQNICASLCDRADSTLSDPNNAASRVEIYTIYIYIFVYAYVCVRIRVPQHAHTGVQRKSGLLIEIQQNCEIFECDKGERKRREREESVAAANGGVDFSISE